MRTSLALVVSLFSTFVRVHGRGSCVDLTIPVTATAENLVPAFPAFADDYQSTYFFNLLTQRDGNASALFAGQATITKMFSISAQFCTPFKKSHKSSIVHVLTHGLGFEKSYWNFTLVPGSYSYTAAALAAGYSTFSYDRIGTGFSSYEDPYTIIQAPMELAILIELTKMVRGGKICGVKPRKVVHIGHSYGSVLSNALAAAAPSLTDAVILTGYSNNASYQPLFLATTGHTAKANQPARFGGYSTGFITWADKYYNQYSFLDYPYFDPNVLIAAEAHKWPFTVGEIITAPALNFSAPDFKGPVLYLAAEHDLIFCGFDCYGIIDGPYSTSRLLFPSVSDFTVYIQPNVGHGINLHYNATGAYNYAFSWLGANGL